jgi:hypothetical protein
MGTFRVIVAGAAASRNYRALRDALEHLLRDRLPAVTILTRSGAGLGTDSLALSYSLARRLDVTHHRADRQKHPGLVDAERVRNAELVRDADAAVLVWDPADRAVRDLLVRCKARGLPIRVLGANVGASSRSRHRAGWSDRRHLGSAGGELPHSFTTKKRTALPTGYTATP